MLGTGAYVLLQMALVILMGSSDSWGADFSGSSLVLCLFVLPPLSGIIVLVAGLFPWRIKHTWVEGVVLVAGILLPSVMAMQACVEPFATQWIDGCFGPKTFFARFYPLLSIPMHLLVLLAALGHVARLGSRPRRWLLLDAPMWLALGGMAVLQTFSPSEPR